MVEGKRLAVAAGLVMGLLWGCGDDPNTLIGGGRAGYPKPPGGGDAVDQQATTDGSGNDPGSGDPGGGGTTTPPASSGPAGPAQTCVDEINRYRAQLGLPAYARWSAEETCSNGQAKSDASTSQPHGAFGQCGEVAQNECPGWPGAPDKMIKDCLRSMWGEGPGGGHYENMRGRYTKVSCGFYTAANGAVWAVQNFR